MTVTADYTGIAIVATYAGINSNNTRLGTYDTVNATAVSIPTSISSLSISRPVYITLEATYAGINSNNTRLGTYDTVNATAVSIPASIPSLSISRPVYTDITATYAGLPSSTSSSKGATLTFSWT
jgi:hypothetical protein